MKQGLFQLIYFTYLHNQLIIGLACALIGSLVLLIKKPERRLVWFFLGFLILILHFEYQKHIVQDLADQTIATLFLEEGHNQWRRLTGLTLYHFVPFLLWLSGWGSVILGIFDWQPKKWRRKEIKN